MQVLSAITARTTHISQFMPPHVSQEVIARLNAIAPTNIIVPDGPPSSGSLNGSARLKTNQGGAASGSNRGEVDGSASVHTRSAGGKEGGGGAGSEAGAHPGQGSKFAGIVETQQVCVFEGEGCVCLQGCLRVGLACM